MNAPLRYAPLSSPLRVRWHRKRFTGEDASGALVFDGGSDGRDPLVCASARAAIRLTRQDGDGKFKYTRVVDLNATEVARIDRAFMRSPRIVLPGGEEIPLTKGFLNPYSCRIGDLARAKSPWLNPRGHIKFIVTDELLNRPDADLLVMLGSFLALSAIRTATDSSA
jgi:hypothetical protein